MMSEKSIQLAINDQSSEKIGQNINLDRFKRLSTIEGNLLSIFLSALTSFVISGYALQLGLNNLQISWLYSSIFLANAAGPIGTWLVGKFGIRKFLTIHSALIARLMYLFLPIITFFEISTLKVSLLVLILTMYAMIASIHTVLWCSWVGSVIPRDEHPQFLVKRYTINTIFGLIGVIIAGVLLDLVPKPWNFPVVIWSFTICGLLAVIPLSRQPDVVSSKAETIKRKKGDYISPLNSKLRKTSIFTGIFHIGNYMILNLLFVYFIRDLSMTYTLNAIWWTTYSISTLYFIHGWRNLAAKHGTTSVLIISIAISAINLPILLIAAKNGFMAGVWIAAIIEGLCCAATSSLMMNLPLQKITLQQRSSVTSGFMLIQGVAGMIGGVIGGFMMDKMNSNTNMDFLGMHLVPFHIILILGSIIKLISIVSLVRTTGKLHSVGAEVLSESIFGIRKLKDMLPDVIPMLFRIKKKEDKTGTDDQ